MELWIRGIKNKQTTDEKLRDYLPIEEQDIDEFIFDYDRVDERLFVKIPNNNIMLVSGDNAIIREEIADIVYFIDQLFVATEKYCDRDTSPQHLCENFVSYYISADKINLLAFECLEFIRLLTISKCSKHLNLEEIITKIENLQKFFEKNKDKCDEFVINFEESEVKILEPRLRLNVENKSSVSKISHKPRRR